MASQCGSLRSAFTSFGGNLSALTTPPASTQLHGTSSMAPSEVALLDLIDGQWEGSEGPPTGGLTHASTPPLQCPGSGEVVGSGVAPSMTLVGRGGGSMPAIAGGGGAAGGGGGVRRGMGMLRLDLDQGFRSTGCVTLTSEGYFCSGTSPLGLGMSPFVNGLGGAGGGCDGPGSDSRVNGAMSSRVLDPVEIMDHAVRAGGSVGLGPPRAGHSPFTSCPTVPMMAAAARNDLVCALTPGQGSLGQGQGGQGHGNRVKLALKIAGIQ